MGNKESCKVKTRNCAVFDRKFLGKHKTLKKEVDLQGVEYWCNNDNCKVVWMQITLMVVSHNLDVTRAESSSKIPAA
jgi:hypothetical protein